MPPLRVLAVAGAAALGRRTGASPPAPQWATLGARPAPPPPSGKPHLLFMMADQLRYDTMSAVWPGAKTPALDALAADGARFASAYTSTPTCTPARAALLTGQKPWNHGMLGYGGVAREYPYEMPRALGASGYFTMSIGKDHFGWDKSSPGADPFAPSETGAGVAHGYNQTAIYDGLVAQQDGYHQWFAREMPGKKAESGWPTLDMNSWPGAPYVYEERLHPTAWVGQLACDFIGNYSDPRPFLLKVSFHRPHSPYDPPKRVLDGVKASDLPPVRIAADGWDARFNGSVPGCSWNSKDAWCADVPEPNRTLARRAYYGSVRFVDEWVGKVVATLRTRSLLEHTVILWTADHGDGQADHYHWRKGFPYEFSAHIPMLLRWPESMASRVSVPRGTVVTQVTELRDVFPTLLDASGGSAPAGHALDGKSLFCLLGGAAALQRCGGWREWLDLEHNICYNETNHWSALTDGRMKYIFNAFYETEREREQLFNLTADPYELVDISQTRQAETATWRARMVKQFEEEGRGTAWVDGGVLQRRVTGQTYNSNFPGHGPPQPAGACLGTLPKAGEALMLQGNGAKGSCEGLAWLGTRGEFTYLSMLVAPSLCVGRAAGSAGVELQECAAGAEAQYWQLVKNNTDPNHAQPGQVVNPPSGECLVVNAGAPGVGACAAAPQWVFGTSGRLCSDAKGGDGCLSVARAGGQPPYPDGYLEGPDGTPLV